MAIVLVRSSGNASLPRRSTTMRRRNVGCVSRQRIHHHNERITDDHHPAAQDGVVRQRFGDDFGADAAGSLRASAPAWPVGQRALGRHDTERQYARVVSASPISSASAANA